MQDSLAARHEERRLQYLAQVQHSKSEHLAQIDRDRKLRRQEEEERIRKAMEHDRLVRMKKEKGRESGQWVKQKPHFII